MTSEGELPVRATPGGVRLTVRVQPGARREGVAGLHAGRLRVRVAAPPEDGRANERLVALVAELLGVRQRDVTLVTGASSRSKELEVAGLSLDAARARLGELLAATT